MISAGQSPTWRPTSRSSARTSPTPGSTGSASMPREVARLRAVRNRLVPAESAVSLRLARRRTGPGDGKRRAVAGSSSAAAYEKILLFGEHTWGMDTKLALNPPEFGGRVYDKTAFQDHPSTRGNTTASAVLDGQGDVRRGSRTTPGGGGISPGPAGFGRRGSWKWPTTTCGSGAVPCGSAPPITTCGCSARMMTRKSPRCGWTASCGRWCGNCRRSPVCA